MPGESEVSFLSAHRHALVGVIAVSILVGVYLNMPEPGLSTRLLDWKLTGRYFKYRNYHSIFYRDDTGKGPEEDVLLLLHGFPTMSFDWSKVHEPLKEKFGRIVALDMLGFGFSDKPVPHNYSIFEQADIVQELLRHLAVTRVHLLSHDYGDTVAQELLHRDLHHTPDTNETRIEIRTACLLNGGIFPEIHTPRWSQGVLLHPYVGKFLAKLSNSWLFGRELSSTFGEDTRPSSADLNDWWATLRFKEGHLALPQLLQYIPERRQHGDRWIAALKDSGTKVHFIYGALDPINPDPFSQHFRKVLPLATLDVLPSVGHYVQWEAPDEMIHSYLKFLNGHI